MRSVDGQRIEQAYGIGRHVLERVGHVRSLPGHERRHQRAKIRRGTGAEMRRASSVAIVEPNHAIAACGKRLTERHGPTDHLGSQPGDQEDGRIGVVAETLICEFDAVGIGEGHDGKLIPG